MLCSEQKLLFKNILKWNDDNILNNIFLWLK